MEIFEKGDENVLDAFGKLAQITATVTEQVVQHVAGTSRANVAYLCIGGICGALNILATTVGRAPHESKEPFVPTKEGADISARLNGDTILFGAILAALTLRHTKGFERKDGTTGAEGEVEFSPAVILEALQMYERATGIKPDDKLCPGMVKAARDLEEGSMVDLEKFLQARRSKMN